MRLLILGYSSIAQRRVIPAAATIEAIDQISIASKSSPEPSGGWPKRGRFFDDYATALRESEADFVYLSLPTPESVREVCLGAEGLIEGSKIRICIDLSTTGRDMAVEVAAALKERGMVAFNQILTPQDAENVRAYVIRQAKKGAAGAPATSEVAPIPARNPRAAELPDSKICVPLSMRMAVAASS